MKREILILDDLSDATLTLVDTLTNNGYTVHVITTDRRVELFLSKAAYIHVIPFKQREFKEEGEVSETTSLYSISEALKDIDFDRIQAALLLSPNDELNLLLARFAREKGVPIVIVSVRGSAKCVEARSLGAEVIDTSYYVISRVQRILSLKFSKLTPVTGEVYILEMLITGDSRILGRSIEDIERSFGVDVVLVREGRLVRQPDAVIQAGDYLIAVGSLSSVSELQRNA